MRRLLIEELASDAFKTCYYRLCLERACLTLRRKLNPSVNMLDNDLSRKSSLMIIPS